jgi:hypothetical protein
MQNGKQGSTPPDDWQTLDCIPISGTPEYRLQAAVQQTMGTMIEDLRKEVDFF